MPISFRLPLEYDELLEKRAAEHGESGPDYVRRHIIKVLDAGRRPNGSLSRDDVTPTPKAPKVVKARR